MTSHRILRLNALSTVACGIGMLVTRGWLYPFFGLESAVLLDALAIGLLAYAAALAHAAGRPPVTRQALLFFTIADGVWVAASAAVLFTFWGQLTPVARVLIIAVGIVVEVFATLQFRAARSVPEVA